jgi:SagB-type dehydrogenase family enzyme
MPQAEDRMAVLRYHERSMHQLRRFAPGPGHLDWANQPDPFRTYAGAPRVSLPLAGDDVAASWGELHTPGVVPTRSPGRAALGAFLELALGLTAWKQFRGSRWALRANPSSGNLHPTEGYVLLPEAPGVPAGLYHYASSDHALEQRFAPSPDSARRLAEMLPGGVFLVGLASIHWREAWKYGERAFRYCQHDVGHALGCLRYAAGALGWSARLLDAPGDADVAALLGLDPEADQARLDPADREHPDALVLVGPPAVVAGASGRIAGDIDALLACLREGEWAGVPNALSLEHVAWPEIDGVAAAVAKPRTSAEAGCATAGAGDAEEDLATAVRRTGDGGRAVDLIRRRRSAVDMDGVTSTERGTFFETLSRLLPRSGIPPADVLPWPPLVHPLLFVHRVEGLPRGLYLLARAEDAVDALRGALRPTFAWKRPDGCPASLQLFLLEEGDTRAAARLASCEQAIASDSAFSLGMLASYREPLAKGPWWYRRLFWEAGVLGQALYMEAEAAGLRGTGIGCYFDPLVHELAGVGDDRFRDVYHFTVGGALDDPRLTALPAYPAEVRAR